MYLIGQITSNPLQQQQIVLADGSNFLLQMNYLDIQQAWFITQLTYGTFQLQGIQIVNSPNLLTQWSNLLPFGLACISPSQREPTQLQDFSSGASNLYTLSAAEVAAYIQYLHFGTVPA